MTYVSLTRYGDSLQHCIASRLEESGMTAEMIAANVRRHNHDTAKESYLLQQFLMEQVSSLRYTTLHLIHDSTLSCF
jgi:hypothetical protein